MIHLIVGDAGSGKSEYAEACAMQHRRKLFYAATMINRPDEMTQSRITRHRQLRKNKGFLTVETPYARDLTAFAENGIQTTEGQFGRPDGGIVLLEDLTNLLANEYFDVIGSDQGASERVWKGIHLLSKHCRKLYIVANRLFDEDMQRYDPTTQAFLKELADLQKLLTEQACEVIRVICGIPDRLR